ncbi:MAG: membrane protein insertion efficiency factor YidD [Candidatus Pacebacteria bacterium]|nr:membrane protein insertion efficiency factor YidD [Candidatus Paceibacterota bacterium]
MEKEPSIKKIFFGLLHSLYVLFRGLWTAVGGPRHVCPFYPSCGTYIQIVFSTLPFHVALWYSVRRVVSCHPWQTPRVDMPPVKK